MMMKQASLFNHVLVVADENSSCNICRKLFSTVEEAKGQANIIAEVIAKDNAKVTLWCCRCT